MATVTINGADVSNARISFRIRGTWDAKATTTESTSYPAGTPCTLDIGGDQFIGTVIQSSSDQGDRVTHTVVGGSGRLLQELEPQSYFATTVGLVLTDALAQGGELIGLTVDSDGDILNLPLQSFTGVRGTVADRIKSVLAAAERATTQSLCWRVDFTGGVYVARQLFLPVDIDNTMTDENPNERSFTLALERASAMPGRIVKLHDLTDVTYHVEGTKMRAVCVYGETERSHVAANQAAFIRREMAHVDFYGAYRFTVVGQNADGTLELKGSDARLPLLMSHVPMKLGAPGVMEAKITPGTEVLVEHENGAPEGARVVAYEPGKPGMGLKVLHSGPIEYTAPAIEMGGKDAMVKQIPMLALWSALSTACAPMGIAVPPFADPGTIILKGA